MDKDQVKSKGDDLPGTSKDPTGTVIRDKSSQDRSRQDSSQDNRGNKGPPSSGSGQQNSRSDQQKRS